MMGVSRLRYRAAVLAACVLLGAAGEKPPIGLGTPLTAEAVRPFDIDARADGAGLPAGSGTVQQGEALFAERCASCHGEKGEHPISPTLRLTGGAGTLATANAVQTVGSYWPYATTLYDYIHRAMPFNAPESLSADEVYAVTAYVLFLNGIVKADQTLDAASLPKVAMPNREGFVPAYRAGQ